MGTVGLYRLVIANRTEQHAEALRRAVSRCPYASRFSVEVAHSIEELDAALGHGPRVDVLVMNIQEAADGSTGVDVVASRFPEGCGTQVIYVTADPTFCTSAYRTEHIYLLLKPVSQPDMDAALCKALANLKAQKRRSLAIRQGGSVVLVPVDVIECVESNRRKVRIHTIDGEEMETYATLSEVSDALPDSFIQCHKSFLVNMSFIAELRAVDVVLQSGFTVPVSQRQRKAVRERFFEFLGIHD